MPSSLPTEDASGKAVDTFGIGTYDSDDTTTGEDDEATEPKGESLPGDSDYIPLEYYLSYPTEEAVGNGGKHSSDNFAGWAELPGDVDAPVRGHNPDSDILDSVVMTGDSEDVPDVPEEYKHHTKLPSGQFPAARSDYYDKTVMGSSMWADEDSGAYVSSDEEEDSLPGPLKNEKTMGDNLEQLGNSDAGYVIEDVSDPYGFPSEQFQYDIEYTKSNDGSDGGTILSSFGISIEEFKSGTIMSTNSRQATNIKLVQELTSEFLKKFGKKNIVRRHVLAFLQDLSQPQYLASDIIRCLKHNHKVIIPDVMDTFPVAKTASSDKVSLSSIHRGLTDLCVRHSNDREVSSRLMNHASRVGGIIADIERFEVKNG